MAGRGSREPGAAAPVKAGVDAARRASLCSRSARDAARRRGDRMNAAGRIAIVGGGVIGCAIAWELARRGAPVTLVERGQIGMEASWASAGIVSLPNRPEWSRERIELGRRSLELYPGWVADLEERTGVDVGYRRPGEWNIAVDAEREAIERERAAFQQGLGYVVEEVSPAEARRREPAMPGAVAAAWFAPKVGSLQVHQLTRALAQAAAAAGAEIRDQTPVSAIDIENGRAAAVRTASGSVPADTVVLAAGAWTRLLGDAIGMTFPTRPVKGQLLAYTGAPVRPRAAICGHGGYVRPRPDGSVIVAATEEEGAGFDRRLTAGGFEWLIQLTRTLCPALLEGEVAESWTGLRPGSDTGEPIIGAVPGVEGLWVAAGHFRTGAKEAPATGRLVAESLLAGAADPLLARFAPRLEAQR
ncbi:MAG: glycine oxidase ThiO [Chloroflexota bacterium]